MSRHVVLSAFVHLGASAAVFHPAKGEPRDLRKGERVDPPGEVELSDPEQAARLIKAKAIRANGDAGASPAAPGSTGGRHIGKPGEAHGGGGAASVSHGGKPGKGQTAKPGKGKRGASTANPRPDAAGGASGGVGGTDGRGGGDGSQPNAGGGDGGSPGAGGSPE